MEKYEIGENVWHLDFYEFRALRYAEKYGIVDYDVKGDKMVYSEKFNNEGEFTHIVDLKSMSEIK